MKKIPVNKWINHYSKMVERFKKELEDNALTNTERATIERHIKQIIAALKEKVKETELC